jgi:hypothetical protein
VRIVSEHTSTRTNGDVSEEVVRMSDVIESEPMPKREARKVIDRDLTWDEYCAVWFVVHHADIKPPPPVQPGSPEDLLLRAIFGDDYADE